MDWELAIDRHRNALLRIAAALFAMAGITAGCVVATVPRRVHLAILSVLRPAEAALRRLVLIYGRDMTVEPRAPSVMPVGRIVRGKAVRLPVFRLFDPRKRVGFQRLRTVKNGPRFSIFGVDEPDFTVVPEPTPDDPVDAMRIMRRLEALHRALNDVPGQARRLARMMAKEGRKYRRPMRPGRPPGHRARAVHPVDSVLSDCHALALYVLAPPDT